MRTIGNDLISLRIAAVVAVALLGMAACHSPNEFPPVPPTPAGFVQCVGHANSYVNVSSNNYDLWYAFWQEAPDSSRATLILGIDPNTIDSVYLVRDSIGWGYPSGDTVLWYPRPNVYVTPDSVIEGSHGVDAGTYYYLKKLN